MEPILRCSGVTKTYGHGTGQSTALKDVSLEIMPGQFNAVIGQSGSGKTTLLKILSGILTPDSGEVTIHSRCLTDMSQERRAVFRRKNIGFVFQKYALLPELTNEENIYLPLKLDKSSADRAYLNDIISSLDIARILNKFPTDCSGGEQQRVAIARAFANKPSIIFADEPTGNLDCEHGDNVVTLFLMMQRNLNTTVLMATHNLSLANRSDRVITLRDGSLIEDKAVDL